MPLTAWAKAPDTGLRATWLGHSTVLIEIDGYRVLTDPGRRLRGVQMTFAGGLLICPSDAGAVFAIDPCTRTLAWAFLALGHFAEGSDAGLPTTLPWGLPIPPNTIRLHPVAIYAAIVATILTFILLRQLQHRSHPGDTFAMALATAGTAQFLVTFFRQPYPDTGPLDPIQWISLGMIALAGIVLLLQPRKLVTHAV